MKDSAVHQLQKELSEVAATQIIQDSSLTIAASLKVAMVFGLLAGVTSAATPHTEYHHCLLGQVSQGSEVVFRTVGQRRKKLNMKLQVQVQHDLKTTKAKDRLNKLSEKYNMEIEWKDSSTGVGEISYGGFKVPGEVQLKEKSVLMIVELPRAARFFQTKIKNELQNTLFQTLNS